MLKLIVTDIDGTLVEAGSDHLHPEYYEIFLKLMEKGVHIAVASGRHSTSVSQAFAPIYDKIWVLSQNGSVVGRGQDHKVLRPIPIDWIREIWQELSAHDKVESILDTAYGTYAPWEGTDMYHIVKDDYKFKIDATGGWDHIPEEIYSMFTIYHPDNAESFVNAHLRDRWKDHLNFFTTGQIWVDAVMPGNNKGEALAYLCKELGIDRKDSIAFGDNMNDIPMLEAAGRAYAVSTARPEVLAIADEVVEGPEGLGVLKKLKEIYAAL